MSVLSLVIDTAFQPLQRCSLRGPSPLYSSWLPYTEAVCSDETKCSHDGSMASQVAACRVIQSLQPYQLTEPKVSGGSRAALFVRDPRFSHNFPKTVMEVLRHYDFMALLFENRSTQNFVKYEGRLMDEWNELWDRINRQIVEWHVEDHPHIKPSFFWSDDWKEYQKCEDALCGEGGVEVHGFNVGDPDPSAFLQWVCRRKRFFQSVEFIQCQQSVFPYALTYVVFSRSRSVPYYETRTHSKAEILSCVSASHKKFYEGCMRRIDANMDRWRWCGEYPNQDPCYFHRLPSGVKFEHNW